MSPSAWPASLPKGAGSDYTNDDLMTITTGYEQSEVVRHRWKSAGTLTGALSRVYVCVRVYVSGENSWFPRDTEDISEKRASFSTSHIRHDLPTIPAIPFLFLIPFMSFVLVNITQYLCRSALIRQL